MNIDEIIDKYKHDLDHKNILYDIQKIYYSNKRSYPILLFPKLLEKEISSQSDLIDFGLSNKPIKPKKPKEPIEPKKRRAHIRPDYVKRKGVGCFFNSLSILLSIGFLGGGLYLFITNKFEPPILVNIVLLIFCLYLIPRFFNRRFPIEDKMGRYTDIELEKLMRKLQKEYDEKYEKEMFEYKVQFNLYLFKTENYKKELELYQKDIDKWKSRFNKHIDNQVRLSINSINSAKYQSIDSSLIREGLSENLLFLALVKKYPEYLKVNITISGYYPDLALWVNGVGIDIEIDEPYTIENGTFKEIHYQVDYHGDSVDKKRNDVITNNNWYVLRFAESQIKNNLQVCLQIIESLVNSITPNLQGAHHLQYRKEFNILSRQISTSSWTKEEARSMARTNYRLK